jgi:hypothetical protein
MSFSTLVRKVVKKKLKFYPNLFFKKQKTRLLQRTPEKLRAPKKVGQA